MLVARGEQPKELASEPPPSIPESGFFARRKSTEAFVDFATPRELVPACTHIRSTLIGASIMALKKHGHFERYLKMLPEGHRDEILYAVAGCWMPIELGLVHYNACHAMDLPEPEIASLGASVSGIAQKTVFSFVLKLATSGGVSPWTMLSAASAHWARSYQGSDVAAYRLGPKECWVEVVGNPLAAIPYWRTALRGILTAFTGPCSSRVYVRELPRKWSEPHAAGYRLSWV